MKQTGWQLTKLGEGATFGPTSSALTVQFVFRRRQPPSPLRHSPQTHLNISSSPSHQPSNQRATMSTTINASPGTSSSDIKRPLSASKNETEDVENDFAYGTSVATCSASIRLGFLRRVYSILAVQLAATVFICACFMFIPPLRAFAIAAQGVLLIVATIATFACLIGLLIKKDSYPTNLHLLAGFTIAESMLVASVCAQYAASGLSSLVLEALVITLAIFSGITLYAFVSKKDFSFMGGALFAALLALMGCSFVNLILGVTGNQSPALAFLISWGGSVLFSLYILYDTSLIIHHLGPDDAIIAAVTLYLDILNLFLHILMILSRNRD